MHEISRDRHNQLEQLAQAVRDRAAHHYEFKRAVGSLTDDLSFIANALNDDPGLWRQNRAFHVVHVPSLHAVMTMLDSVAPETIPDADVEHINASLFRATQLAKTARSRLEQSKLDAVKVELDVLAKYAPEPETPYMASTFVERGMDGVTRASNATWQGAKSTAAAASGFMGRLKKEAGQSVERAQSVPKLAVNLQKSVAGVLSDNISKPIGMRLHASSRALKHGVGAGVGLGVVIGVLCPPLLPISAGGAVLAAMRAWRIDMDATKELNAAEREARIAQLKSERSAALRQLTQGASALQMETDALSLTVDVENGVADAVILQGDQTGRTWSSLTTFEKADFITDVAQSAEIIFQILEIGSGDH